MAAGRGRGWAASRGPVHEASHPRRARKRAEATQEPTAPAPGGATGTLRGPRSTWPRVFRPLGSVSSTGRRREWFPPKGTRAPPRGPRVSPQAPRGSITNVQVTPRSDPSSTPVSIHVLGVLVWTLGPPRIPHTPPPSPLHLLQPHPSKRHHRPHGWLGRHPTRPGLQLRHQDRSFSLRFFIYLIVVNLFLNGNLKLLLFLQLFSLFFIPHGTHFIQMLAPRKILSLN